MKIINEENKALIKSWCNNPEEGAVNQARNLASLPFLFKHVALMPDTHQGYGMPIGGVIATKDVVIPNAVGVDIGCGMCAMKTSIKYLSVEQLKEILGHIRETIPVGRNHHSNRQSEDLMPEKMGFYQETANDFRYRYPIVGQEYQSALKQLGTLGGGNHFIEIQKGDDGYIWIMIHSGSRNLGFKVAKHYNKVSQDLCKKWYSNIPEFKGEDGLAFLPIDTEEGQNYLREMNYCLKFAYANRKLMLERIKSSFQKALKVETSFNTIEIVHDFNKSKILEFATEINIHHNYVNLENHFGNNVWIHRKGATSAKEGQLGIIPGSQGTASYIVKGKGNPESFKSCSHGAGRQMSRTKARNELNLKEEVKKLDKQGIIHAIRDKSNLDEASGAYKDIDVVMKEQEDLVDIVVELKPLAVVKG